jgi:spore coat polysaccharide biosynthesis protein SpsF (cytidylyltransferase family)
MRTVAIIQARLASTRLPRKVLADVCGKPLLQHVIERARAIAGADKVVLTIPEADADLLAFALPLGLTYYWHTPPDVLSGYYWAAHEERADVIVRITGDCPLLAPEVCAFALSSVLTGAEFSTNDTRITGYPDGLDCECFTREMLAEAQARATVASDREHVTPWIYRHAEWPQIMLAPPGERGPWPKCSVDTQADLDRVRRIMARIPAGDFSWRATQEAIREELQQVG